MESTFASRVRQYRQGKVLSQQALAELCGLTQGNIAHMENGTEPKQSNVSKLLAGLPDLSPDWLLIGTGPMLRDGRALAPRPAAEPTPGLTSGAATVAEAENVLLRERLLDKQAIITLLSAEVTELRGKSSDSSDAAGLQVVPPNPNSPTFAGPHAPAPALRVQRAGFRPRFLEAAELSE